MVAASPSEDAMSSRASVAQIWTASGDGVEPAGRGPAVVDVVLRDAFGDPLEQPAPSTASAATAMTRPNRRTVGGYQSVCTTPRRVDQRTASAASLNGHRVSTAPGPSVLEGEGTVRWARPQRSRQIRAHSYRKSGGAGAGQDDGS